MQISRSSAWRQLIAIDDEYSCHGPRGKEKFKVPIAPDEQRQIFIRRWGKLATYGPICARMIGLLRFRPDGLSSPIIFIDALHGELPSSMSRFEESLCYYWPELMRCDYFMRACPHGLKA